MSVPLISVIIPCYNQGHYLRDAIKSVHQLDYPNIEIVVIDDGSTDNTRIICQQEKDVNYFYQPNLGLPTARNTGTERSHGDYLIYLDADDWLYPEAITRNLHFLESDPELAFVSGCHNVVNSNGEIVDDGSLNIVSDHYIQLLQRNYIGNPASVLYPRRIAVEFPFDCSIEIKACEDYDQYLRITKKYKVLHHQGKISVYRKHHENMSNDFPLMLKSALNVLKRQKRGLRNEKEKNAWQLGEQYWTSKYISNIYSGIFLEKKINKLTKSDVNLMVAFRRGLLGTFKNRKITMIKTLYSKYTPGFLKSLMRKLRYGKPEIPPPGKVNMGDLARLRPLSTQFGYDRGGPVDRIYIEEFLEKNATLIKGRVLEIGDNTYTYRYGKEKITKSDILHVNADNPLATFIGDLSENPDLPSDAFDCIILTQTLHLIYDFNSALETCRRVLKPGGVLLMTVPGIVNIDYGAWSTSYWSFTSFSIERLVKEIFHCEDAVVNSYGNVFSATAFLYGMGAPELTPEQIAYHDEHYQVVISAKVVKPR